MLRTGSGCWSTTWASKLFDEVVLAADRRSLLSDEHFTVDGTLIEAAASLKSFKPREADPPPDDGDRGNPSVDFHGERRTNATHQSSTDPEARFFRKGKGKEAKLTFMAHAPMENRNGLLVDFLVSEATGTAERDAVPVLLDEALERGFHPQTLAADRATTRGVAWGAMRARGVTPHVAQHMDEDGGRIPEDELAEVWTARALPATSWGQPTIWR